MADVKLVKSIYTVGDVTSLGELAAVDNARIPGSLEVIGATNVLSINALTLAAQAVGFTIAGGTTSKTLTVSSNADTKDIIKGDGTAGRVLRSFTLRINNGTVGNSLKVETSSNWNGDVNAEVDNLDDAETISPFSLADGGISLRVLDAGISGSLIGVLAVSQTINNTTVPMFVDVIVSGANIRIQLLKSADGSGLDMRTLVNTGAIWVVILYVTSA